MLEYLSSEEHPSSTVPVLGKPTSTISIIPNSLTDSNSNNNFQSVRLSFRQNNELLC